MRLRKITVRLACLVLFLTTSSSGWGQIPLLQSRPSAANKIYLDFAGDPNLTTIRRTGLTGIGSIITDNHGPSGGVPPFANLVPSGVDATIAITENWRIVADRYSMFNVDVTTDPNALSASERISQLSNDTIRVVFDDLPSHRELLYSHRCCKSSLCLRHRKTPRSIELPAISLAKKEVLLAQKKSIDSLFERLSLRLLRARARTCSDRDRRWACWLACAGKRMPSGRCVRCSGQGPFRSLSPFPASLWRVPSLSKPKATQCCSWIGAARQSQETGQRIELSSTFPWPVV